MDEQRQLFERLSELSEQVDENTWRVREGQTAPKCFVGRSAALTMREAGDIDLSDRTFGYTFSDESVDSHDSTLSSDGWILDEYERNNVVLWAHDRNRLPLGEGNNVRVENEALRGDVTIHGADVLLVEEDARFADSVVAMLQRGYLRGGSVGFIPVQYVWNDQRGYWAIDYVQQILREFSVAPVPSNANALAEARSVHGIDTLPLVKWCARMLDGADHPYKREWLEESWRKAGAERKVFSFDTRSMSTLVMADGTEHVLVPRALLEETQQAVEDAQQAVEDAAQAVEDIEDEQDQVELREIKTHLDRMNGGATLRSIAGVLDGMTQH